MPVSEPRLLAAVRAAAGPQVERLLTPPVVPDGESAGVPVAPFPRWLRCPLCSLLSPIDHGVFQLRVDAWRPERTTYVHEGCPKGHGRRPPTAFPARYLMSCQDGHLDDFPWVEFTVKSTADLKKLQAIAEKVGIDDLEEAIAARRDGLEDGDPGDLRTPEWRVLSAPEEAPETPDFKLRSVGPPEQFADRIAVRVQVPGRFAGVIGFGA